MPTIFRILINPCMYYLFSLLKELTRRYITHTMKKNKKERFGCPVRVTKNSLKNKDKKLCPPCRESVATRPVSRLDFFFATEVARKNTQTGFAPYTQAPPRLLGRTLRSLCSLRVRSVVRHQNLFEQFHCAF